MENKKLDISVIMPALDEENNILGAVNNTLQALRDYKLNGEILIINDGSSDKTGELVRSVIESYADIRLIRHDAPMGIGYSFWEGVDNAKADMVVLLPGDNENDPWEIFRYFTLLDHVDIVIPFIFNKETRSVFRNALSFIYRTIINCTFSSNFNYTNGTVLYRKSVLKALSYRSSGFFFQTDILIRSVKNGYLFAEVPYRLGLRKEGVSKAVSFPSFIQVIKGYLRLVRDYYFENNKPHGVFVGDSLTAKRRRL